MRTKLLPILLGVALCVAPSAHADLLCAKKSLKVKAGVVKLSSGIKTVSTAACPSGYALVKDLSDVHDKNVLAFGRIAEDGSVTNFGGSGVTAVSASPLNTGDTFFEVTLTGSFSGLTETDSASNRAKLSVLSNAYSFDYGVTNASITSATSTSIVLDIFIFRSNDVSASFQKGITFAVFKQ